jgi:protein O-mannosyl-transferase
MTRARPLRIRDAVIASALLALVVALPSIVNGFTYDDVWIVERNPLVTSPSSLSTLLSSTYWPPTDGHGAGWRPVTLAAFALQWMAGGGRALVYHAVTIGLASLAAGLMALCAGMLAGPTVALIAGLLFAAHPVHVEATATVVGQAELLAAIAYLMALMSAWRAGDDGITASARAGWLVALALATVLGLGAKEHAITLPGALVVLWFWRAHVTGRPVRAVARREMTSLLVTLLVCLGYLLARRAVLGDATDAGAIATGLDPSSALQRAIVMLPVSLRWLVLLVAPIHLSADYSPGYLVPDPYFGLSHLLALAVWVGLGLAVWRVRRNVPVVALGCALFVITVSVVANVLVPLEVLLAERLLYLPSVGVTLAFAGALATLAERVPSSRRWVIATTGLVVVLLAARSAARAPVWRSNDVLFAQMERDAPGSFRPHWAHGAQAFAMGDSVRGEREWREAIRLNPDNPQPLEDLGRLYAQAGRLEPAIPLLDRAVQLDSSRRGDAVLLAIVLSRTGQTTRSLMVLDAMERLYGSGAGLDAVRADILRRDGDTAAALIAARRAAGQAPDQWRLRLLVADLAYAVGLCPEADSELVAVRRLGGTIAEPQADSLAARVANRKAVCK